jgi:hypothetical protein
MRLARLSGGWPLATAARHVPEGTRWDGYVNVAVGISSVNGDSTVGRRPSAKRRRKSAARIGRPLIPAVSSTEQVTAQSSTGHGSGSAG